MGIERSSKIVHIKKRKGKLNGIIELKWNPKKEYILLQKAMSVGRHQPQLTPY